MRKPLAERQELLTALLAEPRPSLLRVGNIEGQGVRLYHQAVALKLEGIVAKRLDSIYVPGERTANWLKIKRPGAVPAQRFKR